VLHTLRESMPELHKVLPKEAVRNKDRLDWNSIFQLRKPEVTAILESINSKVVHTFVPVKFWYTEGNRRSNCTLILWHLHAETTDKS